jgi:glycosyltransferase involved in cell wall biosynthesis
MVTFYILANAVSPPGTMGGNTKIFLEFAKRWATSGNTVNIVTSESGYETCQNYNLTNTSYFITSSFKTERFGLPIRHLIQTIKASINALKGFPRGEKVIIYSASNFWPDVVPAIFIKKNMPGSKWVGTCYLPIPNPFRGFELAYEEKLRLIPDVKALGNYFVEKPSSFLLKRYADFIFVTNDLDKQYFIDSGFPKTRLKAIYGGVDLEAISKVPDQKVIYDGCFVGRLHPQKGVLYLIKIWSYVCKEMPKAKLAIVGNGSRDYENKVKDEIKKRGLERNIDLIGFADGIKKYKILKSSRVFLHTSIYDNSGMAAAEGLACGLPAVRFDIPALKIAYPKGMLVSQLKDSKAFAENVLILLKDDDLYLKTRLDALSLAKDWDWNKKAKDILNFIK